MRGWMLLVMLMGCGEPVGATSAALWDGGSCELPDRRLYELRFGAVDGDCGEVRSIVRRLDGPSRPGYCRMDVSASLDEDCGIAFVETCDDSGLRIVGDIVLDGEEWRGVADVTRSDEDGELCAGRYDVRTRPVY